MEDKALSPGGEVSKLQGQAATSFCGKVKIYVLFLLVGNGCGWFLVNALFQLLSNRPSLNEGGKLTGEFSIITGCVGLGSAALYIIWIAKFPEGLPMHVEQRVVTGMLALSMLSFCVLAGTWHLDPPRYPALLIGVFIGNVVANMTYYFLFPVVASFYGGWLVAPVRAGTDFAGLLAATIGSAENPDGTGKHLTFSFQVLLLIFACISLLGLLAWKYVVNFQVGLKGKSEESEAADDKPHSLWSAIRDGLACPINLLAPVIIATVSQVCQWGVAFSFGQVAATMTDPTSCTGDRGSQVWRLALTSSQVLVPVCSMLSSLVRCPRVLYYVLFALQMSSAIAVCLAISGVARNFWMSYGGQNVFIAAFALTGGLEGYLLTMAYRYIGDAEDVPFKRRQSAARLLGLMGVIAVNPVSIALGHFLASGQITCTPP
mmetsp:Transcript_63984/g.113801  ORF Transcript_63984/g.113801 Transcript_63984/m.113801 type:complete len:431 (-) Transcript_63984:362-1654(-)